MTFYRPEGQVGVGWWDQGTEACDWGWCRAEGTDEGLSWHCYECRDGKLRDTWGQVPELPACVSFLGHCWCVDKEGEYISASLTARSPQMPLCKCTRGCPRWTRVGPGLGCQLLLPSSGGPVRRLSQTTFSQVPSLEDFADLGPPEFVLLVSQMERGS